MRVWVDCTAAAHPLTLRPFIDEIRSRGHEVAITTRTYGQTEGILERLGLPYESFGTHAGAGTLAKGRALAGRSARLLGWARRHRPDLALAHGSVDLAVVGTLLRIPQVQMQDYEHAGLQRKLAWRAASRVIVPELIPADRLLRAGASEEKLVRYPGLKEDYYLAGFEPDPAVLAGLGLERFGIGADRGADERVLLTVRPPPESSAYHVDNPLYERVLDRIESHAEAVAVLIPRTEAQRAAAIRRGCDRLVVPDHAIDAQSLIAFSDLVVSAGGTMNREAVALGVPVWTLFSGRLGAVDEHLIEAGQLRPLNSAADMELVKRKAEPGPRHPRPPGPIATAILEAAGPAGATPRPPAPEGSAP